MDQEREEQLYRLQADFCQALADSTRLKLLSLLGERPRAVKDLVEATGERQARTIHEGGGHLTPTGTSRPSGSG